MKESILDLSQFKPTINGLAYIDREETLPSGKKQHQLTQCTLFNVDQTEQIKKSVSVMNRFFDNMFRLDGVRDAYKEFKNELGNLDIMDEKSVSTVDRRFRAYVLEWKLFIDHWERFIKDGAQTAFWQDITEDVKAKYLEAFERVFKDVTTETYEKQDDYVLATAIRNHVSHAFNAVDKTDYNAKKVYIDRYRILTSHKVSASQKEVLERQERYIDLEMVADGSLKAAEHVDEELLNFMIDSKATEAAAILLSAYTEVQKAGLEAKHWIICEFGSVEWMPSKDQYAILTRVADENGKPIETEESHLPLMVPGMQMHYDNLNWSAYIAFGSYMTSLWKKGYWKIIQVKYFDIADLNKSE